MKCTHENCSHIAHGDGAACWQHSPEAARIRAAASHAVPRAGKGLRAMVLNRIAREIDLLDAGGDAERASLLIDTFTGVLNTLDAAGSK